MGSALSDGISILGAVRVGAGGERAPVYVSQTSLEASSGTGLGVGTWVAILPHLSTGCQDPLPLKGFSVGK